MAHIWGRWEYGEKIYKKDLQAIEDKIAKLPTKEEVAEFEEIKNKVVSEDFYRELNRFGNYKFTITTTYEDEKYFNDASVRNIIKYIKKDNEVLGIDFNDNIYKKEYYNGDNFDIYEIKNCVLRYIGLECYRGGDCVHRDGYSVSYGDRGLLVSKLTQTNSSGKEETVTTAQLKNPTSLSEQQEFNVYLVNPFTGEDIKASNILNITIKHQPPASIAVTTNPTKMVYNNQDSFDPTGMVVKAYDSSGNLYETTGTPGGVVPNEQLSYSESELLAYTNSNRDVNVTVNWDTFGLSTVMSDSVTVQPTNPDHMEIEASDINYSNGDSITGHVYRGVMVNSDGTPYKNADYVDGVIIRVSTDVSKAELSDDTIGYDEYELQELVFNGNWNDEEYSNSIVIKIHKKIPDYPSDLSFLVFSDIIQKYHEGKIDRSQIIHWEGYNTPKINNFNCKILTIKEDEENPKYKIDNDLNRYIILLIYGNDEDGFSLYDNVDETVSYDWRNCDLRTYLNQTYLNEVVPEEYRSLFKEFTHYYCFNETLVPVKDKISLFSAGEYGHIFDNKYSFLPSNINYNMENQNYCPDFYYNMTKDNQYFLSLTSFDSESVYTFYNYYNSFGYQVRYYTTDLSEKRPTNFYAVI